MAGYIASRLALLVPTLIGVTFLVFLGMHLLPGDPVMTMLSETNTAATPETMASIRHQLGLDEPWPVQYINFLGKAVRGDLGESWRTRQDVLPMIAEQFPSTLELAVAGLGLAIVLGTILGTAAAVAHGTWLDSVTMVFAMLGVSMPSFWLGLLLLYLFSVHLGWISIIGADDLLHLILPAVVLAVQAAAAIARLIRSSMLEVLRLEYVTTARAKGLSERRVIFLHTLPNALIPTITMVGLQFGGLLGGAFIIEIVFARQGIGQIAVTAIQGKDYPVVQGVVLLVATSYILINLAVDMIYALVDPRIRYS